MAAQNYFLTFLRSVGFCPSVLVRVSTNQLRANMYEIYLIEVVRGDTNLGEEKTCAKLKYAVQVSDTTMMP